MIRRASGILLLILLVGTDGRSDGRRGNESYRAGDFDAASSAYQEGLSGAVDRENGEVMFGLMNNLGASQYRLENMETALESFEAAAARAESPNARALASYNAGNAAFRAGDLQRALSHYRQALLDNPDDLNAKHNYELVKRQLQEQGGGGEQQQQQGDEQSEQEQNQDGESQGEQEQQSDSGQQEQEEQQDPQNGQQDQQSDEENETPQDPGESQDQQQDPGDEEQQPNPSSSPRPEELSREQAERILEALESDEAELLREVQRMDAPPRRVEKDW